MIVMPSKSYDLIETEEEMPDVFYLDLEQGVQASSGVWYNNVQRLGVGGNAATFLVLCSGGSQKGVLFALKVFRKISNPTRRERFLNEIRFLQDCNHPAIIRVFDEGTFVSKYDGSEYPFVVTEYLPNTLYEVIRKKDTSIVQKELSLWVWSQRCAI